MAMMTILLLARLFLAEGGAAFGGADLGGRRGAEDSVAVTVMTWNVYVGDDIESLLAVSNAIPLAAARAFSDVQASNYPERAEAVAEEIRSGRPHLIGLQEVSLFRIQSPGDAHLGNAEQAEVIVLDYLGILLEALRSRGLEYSVAARSENFDVEIPISTAEGPTDVRLTDYDVILARSDVTTSGPGTRSFAVRRTSRLGDAPVIIRRGWAWTDATVEGRTLRFVTTHLEPAGGASPRQDQPEPIDPDLEEIQLAQAKELLRFVAPTPLPTVLVGDLNSAADGSTTATHRLVLEAGFADAWSVARPAAEGHTANQDPDLRNPVSKLFHRIDFVFYRDASTHQEGKIGDRVEATVVGGDPADRTPSGLWPSDHAGVVATLRFLPRR